MDNIRHALLCPITQEYPTIPVETPCGHIFESIALLHWIVEDPRSEGSVCPTCRNPFHHTQLQTSHIVHRLIKMLNLKAGVDVATQTEMGIDCETQTESLQSENIDEENPMVVSPVQTYLFDFPVYDVKSYSDRDDIPASTTHRVVEFIEPFNFASTNITNLRAYVPRNQLFLRRIFDEAPFYSMPIKKYAYQHTSSDLNLVIEHLQLRGIFVFDIFKGSKRGNTQNYILYSVPFNINGFEHNLCEYRPFGRNSIQRRNN